MNDQVFKVGALFDALADDYDQSGVAFFRPIAERLVDLLDPEPGELAVDVGCGRGAVTFPLAEKVTPGGQVTAVDLSSAMVERVLEQAARSGVGNVDARVMDARSPDLPEGSFDLLASSLVLFFLPDAAEALTRWVRLVRPGGRTGVTTFGEYDDTFRAIDELFRPHLPPHVLDARTSGQSGPFGSDAGMEELMRGAGADAVRTVREPITVSFADAGAWRRWTMSTGQRMMWGFVPEAQRADVFATATAVLEGARNVDTGVIELRQDVRHTLGRRPS